MNGSTLEQVLYAANNQDAFAITILGLYHLDNAKTSDELKEGVHCLTIAGNSRNCIWAKNVLSALGGIEYKQPFSKHVLVESDALEQLKIYSEQGNMWAMTALGNLLFTGYSNPQNQEEGAKYLNMAAAKSCYLALELIQEYGIKRVSQPTFGKIYDALKNKDYSKFWLK